MATQKNINKKETRRIMREGRVFQPVKPFRTRIGNGRRVSWMWDGDTIKVVN